MAERVTDCPDCAAVMSPSLIGACASVGIEHGMSTFDVVRSYLNGYHERGHVE